MHPLYSDIESKDIKLTVSSGQKLKINGFVHFNENRNSDQLKIRCGLNVNDYKRKCSIQLEGSSIIHKISPGESLYLDNDSSQ